MHHHVIIWTRLSSNPKYTSTVKGHLYAQFDNLSFMFMLQHGGRIFSACAGIGRWYCPCLGKLWGATSVEAEHLGHPFTPNWPVILLPMADPWPCWVFNFISASYPLSWDPSFRCLFSFLHSGECSIPLVPLHP